MEQSLISIACAGLLGCSAVPTASTGIAMTVGPRLGAKSVIPNSAFTKAKAIASARRSAKVGDSESEAIGKLQQSGFWCRRLQPNEHASFQPEPIKVFNCYTSADQSTEGYTLVYATMTINDQGRLVQFRADSYPVVYRNLRVDAQGRTIVVQDTPVIRQ